MPWKIALVILTATATAPIAARLLHRAAAPIGLPAAAGLTAAASAVVALRHAGNTWLPVPATLTVFAVPLALADLRHLRLPDVLTIPAYPAIGVAIGAASLGGGGPSMAIRAAAGALLFGGAHALVHLATPTALGAGDVKLSGGLGAVLGAAGWPALPVAALLAALITALVPWRARGRVPHGPALLTATWLCALFPLPP